MINEVPVADYLDQLKLSQSQPVIDYAFASYSFESIQNLMIPTFKGDTFAEDESKF